MIKVSIIIPCYNAAPWIREALQSAIRQDVSDTEIIVIDDGSTDDSAGIVEREFFSVRLVRTKNEGPSRARTLGTKLSHGKFIQYLDSDDVLPPQKIKIQLEALKNSGADIAYGNWRRSIKIKNGTFEQQEAINRRFNNPEIDLLTGDCWCPIHLYLYRSSIVEKIGGFSENLPVIQDARFALDCALNGAKFVYCPEVTVEYRIHSSNSVSTKNSIAFVKDCLKNASEVERWWQDHGGVSAERKKALLKVYGYVARASFDKDKPTFEVAYRELERLSPVYIPDSPGYFRLASQLFGYRNAEKLASWYRSAKIKISK